MDNEQKQLSLENLMIAAPCDADWDDMTGGERVPRCGQCQLNVYNVKNLTGKEVEKLLGSKLAADGNLCLQLYRRADGTLLTKDCPGRLARVRAFSTRVWSNVAAAILAILTGSSALAQDASQPDAKAAKPEAHAGPIRTMGKICPTKANSTTDKGKDAPPAQRQSQAQGQAEKKVESGPVRDNHTDKAHYNAFNLYKEGQQLEKAGAYAKAAEVYQQALTTMSKQKHDPKFHLKMETAASRAKAKAGINQ